MSTPDQAASSPRNLEQQHKLAKDLLKAARAGDAEALKRIRAHRTDASEPALADAQLTIARETGFASWPALVEHLHLKEFQAFGMAVHDGNVEAARRALQVSEYAREHINDPIFDFGGRATHCAANNKEMLDVLISFGADIHLKSNWENGPYTVLDHCNEESARYVLSRGAKLTPNVASRLGWFDELKKIVEDEPSAVHERGGDGQQPLHQAKTVEIADYLLDHGAEIDSRCIDHKTTLAQYALAERPDICRRLLERGALPDIFMAARLGDLALTERLLNANPSCVAARVNAPGYDAVPPSNIYCWTLDFLISPHEVALKYNHREVYELLLRRSPIKLRFLDAVMRADEPAAKRALSEEPSIVASFSTAEHAQLAQAIFFGKFDAADLMIRLGFDPLASGTDTGTALHMAGWMGNVALTERLLALPNAPINVKEPTHGGTPIGWAIFGSMHRCAKGGDYAAVVEQHIKAGADLKELKLEGSPQVQEALRRHGIK